MELIVFDLDGTLLNQDSAISDYTSETLRLLAEHDIAYTVATGRTLHGPPMGLFDFYLARKVSLTARIIRY